MRYSILEITCEKATLKSKGTLFQKRLRYLPFSFPRLWASMDSVTEPIWFTFKSKQLQAFLSTAIWILFGLVTVKSSPTIWMSVEPVSFVQPSQSSWKNKKTFFLDLVLNTKEEYLKYVATSLRLFVLLVKSANHLNNIYF